MENKTVSQKVSAFTAKIMPSVKKVLNYAFIVGVLVGGFALGRWTADFPPKVEASTNPYNNVYSSTKVSIAVNEANELMLIDRNTGKYQMYSDSVGMSIFKMYSNRIYQKATNE